MGLSVILLSVVIMNFSVNLYAQKKGESPVQWKIGGQLPSFNSKRAVGFAGPVTGMSGNRLIIAGGANFPDSMPWTGGKKKYHDSIYVYEYMNDSFVLEDQSSTLPISNAYAANCTTSKGIVYAGGENENGISNKVTLLRWDTQRNEVVFSDLPQLPVALTNAGSVAIDGIVYIGGGETTNAASGRFFCLDLKKEGAAWKELPSVPKPVSHAVWIANPDLHDQSLFLIGGRAKNTNGISNLYQSVYRFDIGLQQWEEKAPLPYALSAGTGIAVDTGQLLIFGGDKGETFHQAEKLLVAIRNENDDSKKAELINKKNELQSNHPGFSRQILLYDLRKDVWEAVGCMPYETPVTTSAISWNSKVIIPSGEVRAGVRSPHVLVGTIKFK